eukprot:1323995-Prymnesium_polylepis.1
MYSTPPTMRPVTPAPLALPAPPAPPARHPPNPLFRKTYRIHSSSTPLARHAATSSLFFSSPPGTTNFFSAPLTFRASAIAVAP